MFSQAHYHAAGLLQITGAPEAYLLGSNTTAAGDQPWDKA
jgi:hypothetical protein